MENTTYKFKGVEAQYDSKESSPVGGSVHAKVKIRRMQNVLESPSVQVPSGLTKEELRAFIIAHAKA